MRMEPLLFADENAPEWAFSKRKGVILIGVIYYLFYVNDLKFFYFIYLEKYIQKCKQINQL